MVKINFLKTEEIKERLTKIQRVFIQEKQLNLYKDSKLCVILTYLILISCLKLWGSGENHRLIITFSFETSCQVATGGGTMGLELPKVTP